MHLFTRPPSTGSIHHYRHRFFDPHLRSRAELEVIADHRRDLAAHADPVAVTAVSDRRVDDWRDPQRLDDRLSDQPITARRIA